MLVYLDIGSAGANVVGMNVPRWLKGLFGKKRQAQEPKRRLICMRLNEMLRVHPEQITRNCCLCNEEVGIYPSGQRVLAEFGDQVEIVCHRCSPPGLAASLAPGGETEPSQSVWR